MSVPSGWPALLLLAASYRVWRLLSYDTITEKPRTQVLRWLDRNGGEKWEIFVTCPWCAGYWITVLWWAAWQLWPHGTLVAATPLALSLAVGLLGSKVDTE